MLKLNQISVNATNNNQATPLMRACFDRGRVDNMKTLIQYGADINARDIDDLKLLHFLHCRLAYEPDKTSYLGWLHTNSLAPLLRTRLDGTTLNLASNAHQQPKSSHQ